MNHIILEFLVDFIFETTHQNVLKLTGSDYGVVFCNPDVELVCDNRAFPFKLHPK